MHLVLVQNGNLVFTAYSMPYALCSLVRSPKNALFAPKKSFIGPIFDNFSNPVNQLAWPDHAPDETCENCKYEDDTKLSFHCSNLRFNSFKISIRKRSLLLQDIVKLTLSAASCLLPAEPKRGTFLFYCVSVWAWSIEHGA